MTYGAANGNALLGAALNMALSRSIRSPPVGLCGLAFALVPPDGVRGGGGHGNAPDPRPGLRAPDVVAMRSNRLRVSVQ